MADALIVAAGLVVIGFTLDQVFRDLFRPSERGALSDWIGRTLFNLLRRRSRSWLAVAGPAAVVLVIISWVTLLAIGFALLYVVAFPADFQTSTGAVPSSPTPFLTCLYLSAESIVTFGFGDIVPKSTLLRYVAATEGLLGFGLLTASVSSIVLLFPAFSRMRLLALSVKHVVEAERATGILVADTGSDTILSALAGEATRVRIDLVHYPIAYYFAPRDPRSTIAYWAPELVRLAREGSAPSRPPHVRLAAATLDKSLDDLAAIIRPRLPTRAEGDRDAVFRSLADHHMAVEH
jgi:hypothetical protein